MLEPVALHQTGFRVPGLVPDARGVVVSTHAAVLLLGQERLVTLLRLLSEEAQLSDLLPSLRIEQVRNSLGAQAYLLFFACADSRLLDRCGRAARLAGSALCVGAGQHFVAYRDRRSQLGYDAAQLIPLKGDYALYTEAFAQSFQRLREVSLLGLLATLPLLRLPGGATAALPHEEAESARADDGAAPGETLWLECPEGLRPRLLGYLFRAGVLGQALVPGDAASMLLGLTRTPRGLLRRLLDVPGLRLYSPQTQRLFVELGYVHPLRLAALEPAFAKGDVFLFAGGRRGFATLPSPQLLPAERLVDLRYAPAVADAPLAPRRAVPREPPATVRIPLRLVPCATPFAPTATLLPWTRARALGRILYLLPLPALAGLRAVCLDEGILVLGAQGVPLVPLGELHYEVAPGVLAPLGWQLSPALLPSQLPSHYLGALGGSPETLVLLRRQGAQAINPLLVPQASLRPLSLSLLTSAVPAEASPLTAPEPPPPEVRNDPLPAFALWPLWGAREDDP